MTRATVRAVRFRTHDPDLATDVLAVVGYKAVEGETWAGPFRQTFREARADALRRNQTRSAK